MSEVYHNFHEYFERLKVASRRKKVWLASYGHSNDVLAWLLEAADELRLITGDIPGEDVSFDAVGLVVRGSFLEGCDWVRRPRMHWKVALIFPNKCFIGGINLSPSSSDDLMVEINDRALFRQLKQKYERLWNE